jgi:prepilin-type N-terminal cleavage/methylation domain-containing protein
VIEPDENRGIARGFTAIEMLVVVAVIGVLLAILLPSLFSARRSSVEMTSIAQVTKMFDTLMHVHTEEGHPIPGWWIDGTDDTRFVIRSSLHIEITDRFSSPYLPLHEFNVEVFEDPFRTTTIANDPLLARLGPFVDADHGKEGFGYLYVPFTTGGVWVSDESRMAANSTDHPMWDRRPRSEREEPPWTWLNIPAETEYLLWGVGKNGRLDGDPALDVVLIKLPNNEGLVRHRPVQAVNAALGKTGVEKGD